MRILSHALNGYGGFCSRPCVHILTRVARVNNLALLMHIASASHIGKGAAASRYCINSAAMASTIPWHVTYKSGADACGTEACDGRIPCVLHM